MFGNHIHHLHPGAWIAVVIIAVLAIAAFEVWMIVDAVLNRKLSDKAKAWWIVGMVLIHPFVAIIYFFTNRRKI